MPQASTSPRGLSRRAALRAIGGTLGLGLLAACAPTPPRNDPKPAAPAATSAPAAAPAKPAEATKPAEAAKPAAAAPPVQPTQPLPTAAPTAAPATVKRGGTLIIGQDIGPVSLDPILTTS